MSLSFLLNGQLICTPLSEFVQANNLNTESVLEIECFLQEPAPIPDQNIVDDDWVASVLVTDKAYVNLFSNFQNNCLFQYLFGQLWWFIEYLVSWWQKAQFTPI